MKPPLCVATIKKLKIINLKYANGTKLNMKRNLQGRMHPNLPNVESEHQNKLTAYTFRRMSLLYSSKKKKKKIRKFPKRKFVKINVLNEFRTSHWSGWFFRNEEERVYFM